MEDVANIIGLIGVACILSAYALVSFERWSMHQARYIWLNMVGTCAVLFSLIFAWNWPGFVLNVAWVLISAYGLWRLRKTQAAS